MVHVENQAEFEAKIAGFRDAQKLWDSLDRSCLPSLTFDESSSLLIYASPIGVKVASVATGQTLRVYGKAESGDDLFYL